MLRRPEIGFPLRAISPPLTCFQYVPQPVSLEVNNVGKAARHNFLTKSCKFLREFCQTKLCKLLTEKTTGAHIILPPNFHHMGFSAPNFAFFDKNFSIRFSDKFPTAKNSGWVVVHCPPATKLLITNTNSSIDIKLVA